jgi:hypothetical protein
VSAVTATQSDFQLQFAPAEIPVLARRYVEGGSEEDEKAFAAGTHHDGRQTTRIASCFKTDGQPVSALQPDRKPLFNSDRDLKRYGPLSG